MNNFFIPPPLRCLKGKQKQQEDEQKKENHFAYVGGALGETILGIKNRAVGGEWKGFGKEDLRPSS